MDMAGIESEVTALESRWRGAEHAYQSASRLVISGSVVLLLGIIAGAFAMPLFALLVAGAALLGLGLSQQAGPRRQMQETGGLLAEKRARLGELHARRVHAVTADPGQAVYFEEGPDRVSRAALALGSRAVPLAGVTAAELSTEFPNPILGLAGMALALAWSACPAVSLQVPLAHLAAGDAESALAGGLVALGVVAGIGLVVAALCCIYLISRPSYIVRLIQKQQGRNVLITHDGLRALRLVQAVNEALTRPA